jgi:hypothetical protein
MCLKAKKSVLRIVKTEIVVKIHSPKGVSAKIPTLPDFLTAIKNMEKIF